MPAFLRACLRSLLGFPEPPVVFGDLVGVPRGHLLAAGTADAAAAIGLLDLAAQLHLHLLDAGQRSGNAFGEQRVATAGERVDFAEVAHQPLDVTGHIGIVAELSLELLEALHRVSISLLELLRSDRAFVESPVKLPVAVAP